MYIRKSLLRELCTLYIIYMIKLKTKKHLKLNISFISNGQHLEKTNFSFDICKTKKNTFETSHKNSTELNMVLLCYINEASLCLFSSLMIGCGIINRRPWTEWAEYKQSPSDIIFDIVGGRGGRWL